MNTVLERVNKVCRYVRDTNNQGISFKKLVSLTRSAFKLHDCDLSIKTKKDKALHSSEFYVHAYYDAEEDFNNETPIEIIVHHNFNDTDQFNKIQITEFLIQIFDATVHEYRHQQQSVQRKYETFSNHCQSPYASYLKDPDELDAYALSIAIELLRNMEKSRARRYMARISVLAKMKLGAQYVSPNLKSYIDHFGLNKITKKLSKKVYKYIDSVDKNNIFI